ncbi:TetR/AcrR family transcriptional regulator [Beijerinckia indica]|uniref:Transcriptional regulator, TetR family n=1 Tax=Beijerinckia indica subsp. indica (strain ATCC 9039 / DSM 1715 / NCIMB 8712) TaxID=395963 RepID=B2IIU8_BEII9|nr:TetR/AcrR family transcriptional regulator [Beijerinckia indica]ACB96160.1 transcriptional regulator, TetR family [Beijerinckia indica subsp. indica ATCC 9039]
MARPSLREKIIDAALECFHEQGFLGCSVQDITDAAGAPKGSFYNHFKTKEALALEVLQRYVDAVRVGMLFEGDRPPLERLRAHFEYLIERNKDLDFARGCMIANFTSEMADHYPDMRTALDHAMTRWSTAITSLLRQAQIDGKLSQAKDPERLARFMICAWQGTLMRARIAKIHQPFDDFFALIFEDLLA